MSRLGSEQAFIIYLRPGVEFYDGTRIQDRVFAATFQARQLPILLDQEPRIETLSIYIYLRCTSTDYHNTNKK